MSAVTADGGVNARPFRHLLLPLELTALLLAA